MNLWANKKANLLSKNGNHRHFSVFFGSERGDQADTGAFWGNGGQKRSIRLILTKKKKTQASFAWSKNTCFYLGKR